MLKYLVFEAYCNDGIQKCIVCPLKTPDIEIFSLINHREKMAAEGLEYESWSSCSVRTRKGQIGSMGGEKSNFREMKRRRISRTSEKIENILTSRVGII